MTLIDLKPMKAKAVLFPEPVKTLILSEPDTVDAQDFISKLGTWERLLKMSAKMELNQK